MDDAILAIHEAFKDMGQDVQRVRTVSSQLARAARAVDVHVTTATKLVLISLYYDGRGAIYAILIGDLRDQYRYYANERGHWIRNNGSRRMPTNIGTSLKHVLVDGLT